MKEQDYQRKIQKRLEADGYYCIKLIATNKNGIPDIVAVRSDETIFVEVKTPKGRLSKIQEYRLTELTRMGIKCYVSKGDELSAYIPDPNEQMTIK
jgi:Holliday junction resolvase